MKTRNLPAFPAHWIDLHRSHDRDHKEISSEDRFHTDTTPPASGKSASRLDRPVTAPSPEPVFTASNIHYEAATKTQAISCGGIGAIQLLVRKLGLAEAIDERLHLLKYHLPYHESDHVLNFAYNALCNGTCLDDIELRRNDVVFLDALGADRIPDPTTAGDFCRRFTPDDVETLQDVFDQTRVKVWKQQPSDFFDEAVIDADGTLVATGAGCKQGIDIAYDGTWGYHPLIVSLANTGEVLSIVNRPGNRPSHEGAAEQLDLAILLCRDAGFRTHLPPRRHRLHPDQAARRLGRRGGDVPLRHRRHAQPQGDRRGSARVGLGRAANGRRSTPPRGNPGSAPRRSRTGSSARTASRP